jgi:hypothetical protein
MKKATRLPREQADGLPVEGDVEGHRYSSPAIPGLPGTGGDEFRRPSGGGE